MDKCPIKPTNGLDITVVIMINVKIIAYHN